MWGFSQRIYSRKTYEKSGPPRSRVVRTEKEFLTKFANTFSLKIGYQECDKVDSYVYIKLPYGSLIRLSSQSFLETSHVMEDYDYKDWEKYMVFYCIPLLKMQIFDIISGFEPFGCVVNIVDEQDRDYLEKKYDEMDKFWNENFNNDNIMQDNPDWL